MGLAQFVHEGLPQGWPAGSENFGPSYVLVGHRKMSNSPGAELDENGDEFDRPLGKGVSDFLLVRGIVNLGQQAMLHEGREPVGQDV